MRRRRARAGQVHLARIAKPGHVTVCVISMPRRCCAYIYPVSIELVRVAATVWRKVVDTVVRCLRTVVWGSGTEW